MSKVTYVAAKTARPWDRMTGESVQAYGAFLTYKDLPREERSLSRTASDLGKNGSLIGEWSTKWGWQDRIAEWEAELEREKERAARLEAQRAGVRQAAHLAAISRVLILPVEELIKRLSHGEVDLSDWSNADLLSFSILTARAYPRVAVAERLVRGQATEIVAPSGEPLKIEYDEETIAGFWGAMEQIGLDPSDLRALPPGVEEEPTDAT